MPEKRWFWATLTLSSITIVSVVMAAWELVENLPLASVPEAAGRVAP